MRTIIAGLGALCVLAALPARAASGPPELAALDATWSNVVDYQATIVASEFNGKNREQRRFHFSFLRPNHVKAEITDGPLRGMVALWNGGDRVVVYHHGVLAGVRVAMSLHDKVVTSPRGNTVATADFGEALECYNAHSTFVHAKQGPEIDGGATIELLMENGDPLDCPGYSDKDFKAVTKDVTIVDKATDLPLRRMRYVGDVLVEQWDILNLRVNTGLTEKDFR